MIRFISLIVQKLLIIHAVLAALGNCIINETRGERLSSSFSGIKTFYGSRRKVPTRRKAAREVEQNKIFAVETTDAGIKK
jgi:hypothetical protein